MAFLPTHGVYVFCMDVLACSFLFCKLFEYISSRDLQDGKVSVDHQECQVKWACQDYLLNVARKDEKEKLYVKFRIEWFGIRV